MTIKDLKKILEELDENLLVYVEDYDSGEYHYSVPDIAVDPHRRITFIPT